ncbi:MAG: hypothetical protein MJK18_08755, partial [Bdellovibrionales bacterium]|nr:hypothetical protein [Bdellovibrionales bacterium]
MNDILKVMKLHSIILISLFAFLLNSVSSFGNFWELDPNTYINMMPERMRAAAREYAGMVGLSKY